MDSSKYDLEWGPIIQFELYADIPTYRECLYTKTPDSNSKPPGPRMRKSNTSMMCSKPTNLAENSFNSPKEFLRRFKTHLRYQDEPDL